MANWKYMDVGELTVSKVHDDNSVETMLASMLPVGTTVDPYAAPVVETVVTMAQMRLALLAAGTLDDVQTAINALSSPTKEQTQVLWDYGTVIAPSSSLGVLLEDLLNLDGPGIETLFNSADTQEGGDLS